MKLTLKNIIQEANPEVDQQFRNEAQDFLNKLIKKLSRKNLAFVEEHNNPNKVVGYAVYGKDIDPQYKEVLIFFKAPQRSDAGGCAFEKGHHNPYLDGVELAKDYHVLFLFTNFIEPQRIIQHQDDKVLTMHKIANNLKAGFDITTIFLHEFMHILDYQRRKNPLYKSKFVLNKNYLNTNREEYYNNSHELNPWMQEHLLKLDKWLAGNKSKNKQMLKRVLSNFKEFSSGARVILHSEFLRTLNEKNKKKWLQRLYQFWMQKRKQYRIDK